MLLIIVLALLCGAGLRFFLRGTAVPVSVALMVLGLVLGGLVLGGADQPPSVAGNWPALTEALQALVNLDPHLILFIFLPTLIFESAYSLEPHLLRRTLPQILLLAVPGLLISALLTAVLVRWWLPWDWNWTLALLFGALISATDPVAVVALLREVSSRKRLETLLEGESLFNDGTAIVLFSLFFSFLSGAVSGSFDSLYLLSEFLRTVLLGGLVGGGCGWLVSRWVRRIYNDPLLETVLSITSAYLTYFVAEQVLHASGVVAVVMLGLYFSGPGRSRFSPAAIDFLHHFWSILADAANTLIFLLVGLMIAGSVQQLSLEVVWLVLVLYVGLQVIRGVSILVLMPLLSRLGIGMSRDKSAVLIWGGLRGAVALALAMMVARSPAIAAPVGEQVLVLTAGVVVLSLLINGSTLRPLFRFLGLDRLPDAKMRMIQQAEARIEKQLLLALPALRKRTLTQVIDWHSLEQEALAPLISVSIPLSSEKGARGVSAASNGADGALVTEFRRRLLETERQCYWRQYRDGYLGREATARLIASVEWALDGEPKLHPRPVLERYWQAPTLVVWMRRTPGLERWATRIVYHRMILAYDIARGFIQGQNAVLAFLGELAPDDESGSKARHELLMNKRETYRLLELLKTSFPELAQEAEHHSAVRTLLIQKQALIEQYQTEGLLDQAEAERLIDALSRRLQSRHAHPVNQAPLPDPIQLVAQASWMKRLAPDAQQHLLAHVEQRVYEAGEIIVAQGAETTALIIVVRGTVEQQVWRVGESSMVDILGPGDTTGVSAVVEGMHQATLRTVTPVDIFWIPGAILASLIERDPELATLLVKSSER